MLHLSSLCTALLAAMSHFLVSSSPLCVVATSTAVPERLQGKQQLVYNAVRSHMQAEHPEPLRMTVSGTAGTGKCLQAAHLPMPSI